MWTGVVRALACGAIRSFASTFLSSASRDVDLPWGVWERTACASATFVDSASDSAAPSSTRMPGSPVSTRASGIFFTFSPPSCRCLLHLGYARPNLAIARHLRRTPDKPSRIRRTLGPKAFARSCEWEPLVTRRQRTRGGSEFDRMDMRVTDLVPTLTVPFVLGVPKLPHRSGLACRDRVRKRRGRHRTPSDAIGRHRTPSDAIGRH